MVPLEPLDAVNVALPHVVPPPLTDTEVGAVLTVIVITFEVAVVFVTQPELIVTEQLTKALFVKAALLYVLLGPLCTEPPFNNQL